RSEPSSRGNHRIRPRFDAALERRQDISARQESVSELEPHLMRRGQQLYRRRIGRLFPERRRFPDADQEGSGAAGLEIFQASAEVMAGPPKRAVFGTIRGRSANL